MYMIMMEVMQFIVILAMDLFLEVAMIFIFQMDAKAVKILVMAHQALIILKEKNMFWQEKVVFKLKTMKYFNWK